MSGAEVIVPVVLFCATLFKEACAGLLDTNNDAQAFLMLESSVADDIKAAQMFLGQLEKYVGQEESLKICVRRSIRKTREALKVFHDRLAGVEKRKLKWILSDRKAARSLLRPLQAAQSNLSNRIDWMRSALDRLATSPPKEEEGELPSSMCLQAPTMLQSDRRHSDEG